MLEKAQRMACHESAKTTKLYDRREDELTMDEGGEDCYLTASSGIPTEAASTGLPQVHAAQA
jgi:hypothetical protein